MFFKELIFASLVFVVSACATTAEGSKVSSNMNKASQFENMKENSVVVIEDNIDLAGKSIVIPQNCTLLFEGGKLTNGTVTFLDTKISGAPLMEGIIPLGTIAGTVCINWFGLKSGDRSFDNGIIFNQIGQTFNYLYVEPGTYYCSTAIDWSKNNIINLTVDGNLRFIKQNTSETFITLRTTRGVVNFNGTITGPTQKITDNTPEEKSIGICFVDCNNSKIFVKSVGMFYNNIRVLGSSAAKGNAYNDYEFIESYSGKTLVHIDAEKGGWTTSNVYKILRLAGYGGQTVPETALLIHGEGTETSGNFSDTVIEKLCIEGLKQSEPIKIIGANHFLIENIRNEGNYPVLCYCENVKDGKISTNYGGVTVRVDGSSKVDIIPDDESDEYEPLAKSHVVDSEGRLRLFNCVDASLNTLVRYSPLSYTPVGLVVSTKVLNKPLRIQSGDLFTVDIVYYDENKQIIPYENTSGMVPAGSVFFKRSNVIKGAYMSSSTVRDLKFVCPNANSDVAYVGVFLRSHGSSASPVFRVSRQITSAAISSIMGREEYKAYPKSGPTKSRPVFSAEDAKYQVGYQYFDTTVGKMIQVKSISDKGVAVWVDANGKKI